MNRISFAKRNSSNVFMSRIMSVTNCMTITATSLSPSRSCLTPSVGPALTNAADRIVKNANTPRFFFMIEYSFEL